jgi:regulator of sigma E protease
VAANAPLQLSVVRGGHPLVVTVPPELRGPVFAGLVPPPGPPVIGNVATGMPAYKAGLKEGDLILSVNGRPISTWDQLPASLQNQADRPVQLRIRRGTQTFSVTVTPMNPDGGTGANAKIGIEAPRRGEYVERLGAGESLRFAFFGTANLVETVYGGMWLTLTRPLYYREYMGGPIFIVQAAGEQAKRGRDFFLNFLAMINVAIMAFNLLPIPVLDGGHIFLALLEGVRRRALSARAYVRYQKVGLVVIGSLFVLILANDPLRLVQRQRALDRAPQETTHAPAPAGGH